MKTRKGAGRRMWRPAVLGALALFALMYLPVDTSTESMTLTTYYPAPYGVYQKMRSTGETFLAYKTIGEGGVVGIGTTNMVDALPAPGAGLKMRVHGHVRIDGDATIKGALSIQGPVTAARVDMTAEQKAIPGLGLREVLNLQGTTGPGILEGDMMVGANNYLHMKCAWVAYTFPGSTFCPPNTRANFMGDVPNSMGGHSLSGWMGCCRLNTI